MWTWEGFWIEIEGCKGWAEVVGKKLSFVLEIVNSLCATFDIIIE